MRYVCLSLVLSGLWQCCSPAFGDVMLLTNGDRLTGKIKQLTDGKLVFESDVGGELNIDLSKIRTFSSDVPIEVHFSDGTVIKQAMVSGAAPGRIGIRATGTLAAQEFDLTKITSINPPAKPTPKWHGAVSAGFSATQGNTSTERENVSVDVSRRSENDRITVKADYALGKQEDPDTGEEKTTEDWWRTRLKYDYFVSKKLYVYGDSRYEKDSVAELDRRMVVGGGGGYQWIESEDMNFSTEAGLASLYERFDNQTGSNTEVSVQLGYHFDKKLYKALTFINDLTYYPSIGDFGDYYLTSTAELRASFLKSMFANFKVIFDYDATPAEGAGKTDVKYILGVGWSF